MTVFRNSIIAGALARALVAQIERDARKNGNRWQTSVTGGWRNPITLSWRLCRIKGEPSGGSVLTATVPCPSYGGGIREWTTSKRLRSGANVYKHAADLAEGLRQRRNSSIVNRREALYELSERKQYDTDNLPRESSAFDEMDDAEMDFWFEWLNKQPDKELQP